MPFDIKQVLEIIESRDWFSCKFITANQAKKTGGEVRELKRVRLMAGEPRNVKSEPGDPSAHRARQKKAAEHNYHFTRNLQTRTGDIIKVHPLLIFEINGIPVL